MISRSPRSSPWSGPSLGRPHHGTAEPSAFLVSGLLPVRVMVCPPSSGVGRSLRMWGGGSRARVCARHARARVRASGPAPLAIGGPHARASASVGIVPTGSAFAAPLAGLGWGPRPWSLARLWRGLRGLRWHREAEPIEEDLEGLWGERHRNNRQPQTGHNQTCTEPRLMGSGVNQRGARHLGQWAGCRAPEKRRPDWSVPMPARRRLAAFSRPVRGPWRGGLKRSTSRRPLWSQSGPAP